MQEELGAYTSPAANARCPRSRSFDSIAPSSLSLHACRRLGLDAKVVLEELGWSKAEAGPLQHAWHCTGTSGGFRNATPRP